MAAPTDVHRQFGRHLESGLSGGWAWAFTGSQLTIWHPDRASSPAHVHQLPYSASGRHFVVVTPLPDRLPVLLTSEDGNVALWADFARRDAEAAVPHTTRVTGRVTAACGVELVPWGSAVALATEGGSVHVALQQGADEEPVWEELPAGMDRGPAVALAAADGQGAGLPMLLVLRQRALEGWALPPDGDGEVQPLWEALLAEEVERALGGGVAKLLDVSLAPGTRSAVVLVAAVGRAAAASVHLDGSGGGAPPAAAVRALQPAAAGATRLDAARGAAYAVAWRPDEWAALVDLASGAAERLPGAADSVALAADPAGTGWLALSPEGTLARGAFPGALGSAGGRGEGPAPAASSSSVDLSEAFRVLAAAVQGQVGAAALAAQLASSGAPAAAPSATPSMLWCWPISRCALWRRPRSPAGRRGWHCRPTRWPRRWRRRCRTWETRAGRPCWVRWRLDAGPTAGSRGTAMQWTSEARRRWWALFFTGWAVKGCSI